MASHDRVRLLQILRPGGLIPAGHGREAAGQADPLQRQGTAGIGLAKELSTTKALHMRFSFPDKSTPAGVLFFMILD